MIHPTRTNLLHLKERRRAITGSVRILKARRQALIRELIASSRPFLRSRRGIRRDYREALEGLHLSLGHEGRESIESIAAISQQNVGLEIKPKNLMGVKYRDVSVRDTVVRRPSERNYDYTATTPHLEESIHLFEKTVETLLQLAAFENKLKRLGDEIVRLTRRTRVLEERVLPHLQGNIKTIAQYLGERERESYFRLKRFKDHRTARAKESAF
jgi:V/A-type H+-transporting ATPase subunit D